VLLTYLLADMGLVIGTYLLVRRDFGPIPLRFGWRQSLDLMRVSAPFFLFNILTIVHLRLDTLMVGLLLNLTQVAYYDLGMKMLEVARFVIRPFNSVFYPIFSEMAAQQRWRPLRLQALGLTAAAFVSGVAATLGMYWFGSALIVLLFGQGYEASVAPAKILFLSMPLIYVHFVLTILANALHQERLSAWLLGMSALLNLALNVYVIPRFGILGAAWTTLASQAFLTISMAWLIASRLSKPGSA
jgi:O-antigen/teichoic acid export membrane protein